MAAFGRPDVKPVETVNEYEVGGAKFRVADPDSLFRRFDLTPSIVTVFHEWAAGRPDLKVSWTVARLLYGIHPVIPEAGVDPDYYNADWTIEAIAVRLNSTGPALELELDMLVKSWLRKRSQIPREQIALPEPETISAPAPVDGKATLMPDDCSDQPLSDEQEKLLRKRGFDLEDFKMTKGRSSSKKNREMRWLYERLIALERALNDPNSKQPVLAALRNEMQVMRSDELLMQTSPSEKEYKQLTDTKAQLEQLLLAQWDSIRKICPYIQNAVSKYVAVGAISEVIQGLRDFIAINDNKVRDGIYTAYEILVMDRESVQQESHRRPGWVCYHLEADAGLFDPNFKSTMPIAFCQTLDIAHLMAKKAVNERLGITIPNLLLEGAAGEYPDLPELAEGSNIDMAEETGKETLDEEIAAPLTSVPMEGDNIPDVKRIADSPVGA